jgi:hypothetical protein
VTFDPAQLFDSSIQALAPALKVYRSDEAALDAVRARKKPICFWQAVGAEIPEWQALAFERQLAMCVVEERVPGWRPAEQPVRVFIAHAEELWRVPALLALWKTAFTGGGWSDAAEDQMSYLLGYTDKERAAWIAARRQAVPAWTSATVYALLDPWRREIVESVGRRCLGPAEEFDGTSVFVHPGSLKKTAFSLVPKQHTLARFGLHWEGFQNVFYSLPARKKELTTRMVTRKVAAILYAGMSSNVQFLTRKGWA